MTISVPVALELVSTNVIDPTTTFNPNVHIYYPTGMQIQKDGWIWENTGATIIPEIYDSQASYTDGTIVYKDGKLQFWYNSGTRLAQPEEYTTIDNGEYSLGNLFKANLWTHKYVKLGVVPQDQTLYDPDFSGDQADASKYYFYSWTDDNGDPQIGAIITPETATGYSPFTAQSSGIYTELKEDTIEVKSSLYIHDNKLVGTIGSIFIRSNNIYMRTAYDASNEFIVVPNPYGVDITSVDQLPGFTKKSRVIGSYPLDGKNYTKATKENVMTYVVKGLSKFDTVALGHVKATSVDITFKDPLGATVGTPIVGKAIDGSRDTSGNLEAWHTTTIYYSDTVLDPGSTAEITLYGANIELGNLLLGMSVDAGFSNLEITNRYKDFSVFEYDAFGNTDYTERAKVATYNGSVSVKITDYDRIDRLMISLGKTLLIVNGSSSGNKSPNGSTIFSATQKIGRFLSFEQRTNVKDRYLDVMATYTFTLEEIV